MTVFSCNCVRILRITWKSISWSTQTNEHSLGEVDTVRSFDRTTAMESIRIPSALTYKFLRTKTIIKSRCGLFEFTTEIYYRLAYILFVQSLNERGRSFENLATDSLATLIREQLTRNKTKQSERMIYAGVKMITVQK